jgi:transposase-like protein
VLPLKREHRSAELKRQIVEETLGLGASVVRGVRAHRVNAKRVLTWQRQHRQRLLKPDIVQCRGCWRFVSAELSEADGQLRRVRTRDMPRLVERAPAYSHASLPEH